MVTAICLPLDEISQWMHIYLGNKNVFQGFFLQNIQLSLCHCSRIHRLTSVQEPKNVVELRDKPIGNAGHGFSGEYVACSQSSLINS